MRRGLPQWLAPLVAVVSLGAPVCGRFALDRRVGQTALRMSYQPEMSARRPTLRGDRFQASPLPPNSDAERRQRRRRLAVRSLELSLFILNSNLAAGAKLVVGKLAVSDAGNLNHTMPGQVCVERI